jgi:hypothetical protein
MKKNRSITSKKKKELAGLFSKLKAELGKLSKTHKEHAKSIAGFAQVASHQALRKEKEPSLLKLSVEGLSTSVQDFETSHPQLVKTANDICLLLSRIGI